mgnify:CR=1 FL=1
MARKQFDLIVFDWDGTLMDSTATIVKSIQSAARDLGLPIPSRDAASHVIGLGLSEAMQKVLGPDVDPKYYPRMVERYRYHYLTKDHELTLFDGVPEGLDALRNLALPLACLTNKPTAFARQLLARKGLERYFAHVFGGDESLLHHLWDFALRDHDPLFDEELTNGLAVGAEDLARAERAVVGDDREVGR